MLMTPTVQAAAKAPTATFVLRLVKSSSLASEFSYSSAKCKYARVSIVVFPFNLQVNKREQWLGNPTDTKPRDHSSWKPYTFRTIVNKPNYTWLAGSLACQSLSA